MTIIGRGHTIYLDSKTLEYDGQTYKPAYKTVVYVDGQQVAKLYDKERGVATCIGQTLTVTLEITQMCIRDRWGHSIAFLGTVFINMMFCVVVPLVFASIAGSVANMESRQRAGKIMGVTVGTFVITGAIAAVLMFVLMKLFPPVLTPWADMVAEEIGEHASFTEMIVNFFTSSDFVGLLSRRAMLPLIVFSIPVSYTHLNLCFW